jgi:hypothetical protein
MDFMNHSEALQLQAAEKYILGELSPELREEYEEHYFECEECASEVKAAAAFGDSARELFHEQQKERVQVGGWFGWLRPAVAAPALAALLLVVCYQSFVAIPHLKRPEATQTTGSASFISLIGANSRGEAAKTFSIQQNAPAILELDIPPSPEFSSYLCQIQDDSGHGVYEGRVSAGDAKHSVHLIVPGGALQARTYTLRVMGRKSAFSEADSQPEVIRLQFTIEFIP